MVPPSERAPAVSPEGACAPSTVPRTQAHAALDVRILPARRVAAQRPFQRRTSLASSGRSGAVPTGTWVAVASRAPRDPLRAPHCRSTIDRLTIYRNSMQTAVVTDPDSYLPLPQTQFHVLVSLTAGERHGYAIMQDVEASSSGL